MLFFFSFPLPSPFSLFPANHSNFFEDSAPSGGRPCRGNPRNGFRSSAIFYLGHPRGWTEGGREGGRRRVSGGWTGTPFMPRRYYVCTWHANTSVLGQFTVILTVAICSSLSPHPPPPTPPPSLQPQNSIGGIKRLGFDYVVSPSPLPPAAAAADLQVRKLMQVQAAWHLAFLPSALMNPSLMEMPETVIPYNCHITRSMVPAVIATGRATFECSTSALSSLLFPTSSSSFSPSSTPSSTPSSS